ncbi:MAG: pentapeptide repeat-containing protein [Betaproteobacteria bacterium]
MTRTKPSLDLVKRWDAADAMAETKILLSELQGSTRSAFKKSPFGEINGLVDLRGFPFHAASKIVGKSFEGLDLSAASFEGVWLQECALKDVRFDYANLKEFKDHGNRFEGCSFVKSSFIGAGLGYRKTLYSECLFEESDFRKSTFLAARLQSCRFVNAKLKGIDFYASTFDACVFLGRLENVWFRGGYPSLRDIVEFGDAEPNLMRHVSFAGAELLAVNFTGGCDLSSVTLPMSDDYRLYGDWHSRLLRLSGDSSKWSAAVQKEAQIFVQSYLESSVKQSWMLLNVADISEEFGKEIAMKIFGSLDADADTVTSPLSGRTKVSD